MAEPASVDAVLLPPGPSPYFVQAKLLKDHPCFSKSVATPPLLKKLDLPLVVYRSQPPEPEDYNDALRPDLDCQVATYLNIDPSTGFAPEEWQSHVGECIVARADGKSLSVEQVEVVYDYVCTILDRFGDGEGPPQDLYNRASFEEYFQEYRKGKLEETGDIEAWKLVGSLYDA